MFLNNEGVTNLSQAVVIRATKDYRRALRNLKKNPQNIDAHHTLYDCESFFRDEMELYCRLDGNYIIDEIRREVGGKR